DLINGLRPRPADAVRRKLDAAEAPIPRVHADRRILVLPILAPVLLHERPMDLAGIVDVPHHDAVLQADEIASVLDREDALGRPRLVRTRRLEAGREADGLDEVEGRAVLAGHREDRTAVSLEPGQPGLRQ